MTGFLVALAAVFPLDQAVYDWVQAHRTPTLDVVMEGLTHSGEADMVVLGLFHGALLADAFHDSLAFHHLKAAYLGMVVFAPVITLLKGAVNRPRPEPPSPRWNSSFPSGHAALSFYVAGYYTAAYPRWEMQVPLLLWASGVAASRVYLRRHWPTDVLVGGVLGWVAGRLVYRYREKIWSLRF